MTFIHIPGITHHDCTSIYSRWHTPKDYIRRYNFIWNNNLRPTTPPGQSNADELDLHSNWCFARQQLIPTNILSGLWCRPINSPPRSTRSNLQSPHGKLPCFPDAHHWAQPFPTTGYRLSQPVRVPRPWVLRTTSPLPHRYFRLHCSNPLLYSILS
jgi:hypothetical protein